MKQEDYIKDITEIRSMMERSSRFLSLSGWAGILAGIYALAGAWIAFAVLGFNPQEVIDASWSANYNTKGIYKLIALAVIVIAMVTGTAAYLSAKKAAKRNEKLWNATLKRLLANMAVPLVAGGLLVLICIAKGLMGLLAPLTLIFYGISLYIAGKFSYEDIRVLGLANIALGLMGAWFTGYGLLFWALGFGAGHIVYGMYVHYKYEK